MRNSFSEVLITLLVLVGAQTMANAEVTAGGICGQITSFNKKKGAVTINGEKQILPGFQLKPKQKVPGWGCVTAKSEHLFRLKK